MSIPVFDPFRFWRRQRRLMREAVEEAQFLRRRHGDAALAAAREKLASGELTTWGRQVVQRAMRLIQMGRT